MRAFHLILALAALLLATPSARADDDFSTALRALNADSYADKIAAAEALAALGEGRAAPILDALADGRLYVTPDGAILIEQAGTYLEPLSQKIVTTDKAEAITVNNRLRGVARGAAGRLALFSPNAQARGAAVEAIMNSPSDEAADMVRAALAKESDATIKALMVTALASLDLSSDNAGHRLAAVTQLADSSDPSVRSQIQRLLETETDLQVRKVAEKTLGSIEFRVTLMGFVANLFQGLSLGSVLLLAAIGLAVTFGVMGVINMAHGEMIMLGAYTTFAVQQGFRAFLPADLIDLYLVAALPAAFLVTALVGMGLERGIIRFLYGRPLETMLATWGISLVLQQVVRQIFGASNMEVANPSWMTGGWDLAGGFTLTYNRVVIILFCLAVLGGLAALLRWSSFGLHMRAVTQNRPMASAMGIPTGRVDAMTFGLGSGIAGIAGVALSQIGNVSPNLGQGYIVDSFMVVVFGGVGSLWGTLVGAVSLGVVNKFLEPYAGAMLGKILVLVFIILFIQKRPRGLFALKGRSVES
ncbi:urea ABC transporter permease subunit UrtB [Magnetospirillum sulfuroxidans]|uniref:Urea ABC transporter permease subunit UrtB n=1 Tax=Magnetospirillum sulfuroxidans TaxID=611300 RepID=A0ABS5IGN3_9PROT|nr:urea ABC transporter permease subunit UrtB [Magnetospirillum sulfuroxidans]MBR9973554.1 urea ABC transporter permease subunit UrtB [Magnetospirillum sulfuroxidans]